MQTLEQLRSGQLTGTSNLTLSENLSEFPREIFELADSLTYLDLSNNQLSSLPADFSRLHRLKTLFLSKNRFTELPEVLADCDLDIIGFKSNQIAHIPAASLPRNTRWLILTDNQIPSLPDSIGNLHRLQKLMLAGNRLTDLPVALKQCGKLQLIRISANLLQSFPDFLLEMPQLAWIAYAGNPFSAHTSQHDSLPCCGNADFELIEQLGAGASGVIYRAAWTQAPSSVTAGEQVAVKQFKGAVTSDGYPQDELHASLQVGQHANLPCVLAKLSDAQQSGVVMKLIEPSFHNLGLPPSLISCTRDNFAQGQSYSIDALLDIASAIADVMQHMHQKSFCHGDLYAHNILIDDSSTQARVLLSDFGAASPLAPLSSAQVAALQAVEVQAFGHLLDDLLQLCPDMDHPAHVTVRDLQQLCTHHELAARPDFKTLTARLTALAAGCER